MTKSRNLHLHDDFLRFVCQTSPAPLGLEVVRAEGARFWDSSGRDYLDLLSGMGVASVGHRNPDVVAAVKDQTDRYLHTLVYGEGVFESQVDLARELASVTPDDLSVSFFTNSGAEAIEGAMKLARKFTGRRRFACFDGAYHGDTTGALALCGNSLYREPFEPLLTDVIRLPFNDIGALSRIDESAAAVIVEPIQGEGGVRIPHDDFLPALRARCTTVGALLVFDEVITGMGRTGRWFACQHWETTPDVLVLAKALGGGLPLGAFVSRPEVMSTLSQDPPLSHVTTFGGHPLSCAAGLAALRYTVSHRLREHAAELGESWLCRLRGMVGPVLRDVRGKGLLIGLELDSPEHTQEFCRTALHEGLILNWTLHRDTVVRLAPPLIMSEEESDLALSAVGRALRKIERGRA